MWLPAPTQLVSGYRAGCAEPKLCFNLILTLVIITLREEYIDQRYAQRLRLRVSRPDCMMTLRPYHCTGGGRVSFARTH